MRLREEKTSVVGRSMILNVVAIVLNVIGVFCIAKGFHVSSQNVDFTFSIGSINFNWGDSEFLFKTIGFITFLTGLTGLIMLKGMYMFSFVARAFVGGLFIVSGLIKANDPWGFGFKLEEYFVENGIFKSLYESMDAFDFLFKMETSTFLYFSIFICVVEIILGVAIIVGGKMKLASWSLLAMMAGFTFLTYYTYSCIDAQELAASLGETYERECVRDCGCFGDALKGSVGRSLSPYETFWKDIVLIYFVIIIFITQRKTRLNTLKQNWVMVPASLGVVVFFSWVFGWYFPIIFYLISVLGAFIVGNMNIGKVGKAWKMAVFVGLLALLFSTYTTNYLPIKDYRAYAKGSNIVDQMNTGIAEIAEMKYIYTNLETNEDRIFNLNDDAIYGDETKWKFKDRIKKVIEAGVDDAIMDFLLEIDYESLRENDFKNKAIDSIVKLNYDEFYEDRIIQQSIFGVDTIAAYEYQAFIFDTAYYGPDTVFYEIVEKYAGLVDQTKSYRIDLTDYILSLDTVFLMVMRDFETVNENAILELQKIYEKSVENNIPFYIISPASDEQIISFREKFKFDATFLAIDGTEIKIIVRSNPGLVLLNKATIIDKWPSRSIPSYDYLKSNYLK